jgi:prolipoprotein diacylglyceryltransferase
LGLLTLFLFAAQRIIVESFRADPPLLGPLHLGHILSALICLAASFGIVRRLIAAKQAAKIH